jgi:hypothetical protein
MCQPDPSSCSTVAYSPDIYHSVGVQTNIPYSMDIYAALRISIASCGLTDELSYLGSLESPTAKLLREVRPSLLTGGVTLPHLPGSSGFFSPMSHLSTLLVFYKTFLVWGSPEHLLRITVSSTSMNTVPNNGIYPSVPPLPQGRCTLSSHFDVEPRDLRKSQDFLSRCCL